MSIVKQKKITIRLDKEKTYHGDHENKIPNGKGIILYDNGDKFEGRFVHGFKHGIGIFTQRNGKVIKGQWWNDKLEGKAEMFYESRKEDTWDLTYKNDKETSKLKRKNTTDSFELEMYLKKEEEEMMKLRQVHKAMSKFINTQSDYFDQSETKGSLGDSESKKKRESRWKKKDIVDKRRKEKVDIMTESDTVKTVFDLINRRKFKNLSTQDRKSSRPEKFKREISKNIFL